MIAWLFNVVVKLASAIGLGALVFAWAIAKRVLWIVAAVLSAIGSGFAAKSLAAAVVPRFEVAAPPEPREGWRGLLDRGTEAARERLGDIAGDPEAAAFLDHARWLDGVFFSGALVGFLCMVAFALVFAFLEWRIRRDWPALLACGLGASAAVGAIVMADGGFADGALTTGTYWPTVISPLPALAGVIGTALLISLVSEVVASVANSLDGGSSGGSGGSGKSCPVPDDGPDFDLDSGGFDVSP